MILSDTEPDFPTNAPAISPELLSLPGVITAADFEVRKKKRGEKAEEASNSKRQRRESVVFDRCIRGLSLGQKASTFTGFTSKHCMNRLHVNNCTITSELRNSWLK